MMPRAQSDRTRCPFVPSPPLLRIMRIVSLIPGATEALAALGLDAQLVGITHSCDYPPGLLAERVTSTSIPPDAGSGEIDRLVKESAGRNAHPAPEPDPDGAAQSGGTAPPPLFSLDVDRIERLRPDLIVTQSVCDVCAVGQGQALAGLEGLSFQPRMLALHPHRLDDVFDDLARLGAAAGVADRAQEVVADLRARIDAVRRRVEVRPRVSVVVLEWLDPLFTCGHWTPDLVTLAGGRELITEPGQRSVEVDWARIREADPEVLLLACCGQDVDRTREDLQQLASQPGFAELQAVHTDRVFISDGGAYFSRPGPRLVDALELLAETLHPDRDGDQAGLVRAWPEGSVGAPAKT